MEGFVRELGIDLSTLPNYSAAIEEVRNTLEAKLKNLIVSG